MQPIYVTQSSVGSSPWQIANWHISPQQFGFTILSTGGSSWAIEATMEDPTRVYPNPNSSTPTAFTIAQGSSAIAIVGLTSLAIAAYRLTVGSLSSAGAKVTLASMQAGIG